MASSPSEDFTSSSNDTDPSWTYPTRFCRICREDVPPTVTMYPPGLPLQFQRPIVEYKNEDEYGRLMKPCNCRGSSRYIHELCLRRSRTENNRAGSFFKCHECGASFNFQKLALQNFLRSRASATMATIIVMIAIIFLLGFIADPIINFYLDPYYAMVGEDSLWEDFEVITPAHMGKVPKWVQHFMKGLVSMGLVGFLKTMLLNPFHFWQIRSGGIISQRNTTTGRDRAVNVGWYAVLIGVSAAFYFFYRWVRAIIQKSLNSIGDKIVDTQLPGDDDDLKPPPGWKPSVPTKDKSAEEPPAKMASDNIGAREDARSHQKPAVYADENADGGSQDYGRLNSDREESPDKAESSSEGEEFSQASTVIDSNTLPALANTGCSSALDSANSQGWSFSRL